jgi:hypothetical protein
MTKQTEAVVIGGTNEGRYIPLDHFRVGDHRPTTAFQDLPDSLPEDGNINDSIPVETYRLECIRFMETGKPEFVKFWVLSTMTLPQALRRLLRVMAFGVNTVRHVRLMLPHQLKQTEMGHGYDIACDRLEELFGHQLKRIKDE